MDLRPYLAVRASDDLKTVIQLGQASTYEAAAKYIYAAALENSDTAGVCRMGDEDKWLHETIREVARRNGTGLFSNDK